MNDAVSGIRPGDGTPVSGHTPMVGQPVRRTEDPRLLAGLACFVDDIPAPHALHLALVRSDQAHARILSVETLAALAMPGVFGVYVWADLEAWIKPAVAISRTSGYQATAIHALAHRFVRYVGEPVVAILAGNRYQAEDAAEQIVLHYETLPVVTDPIEAAKPEAPLLHEGFRSNILVERTFAKGEIDEVFGAAPVKVGGRFRFHRRTSAPIENRCYLAEMDPGRDAITLYSSTQVPGIIRDALSDLLGMPGHRLNVIAPDVGGGFGAKTSLYPEEMLVSALARKTGRAVKWTGDRLEDLLATSHAFDETMDAEFAVDAQGHILGLRCDVVSDVGAYSIYPWTAAIEPVQVISFMPGPYKVPVYHGHVRAVATPKSPTGPNRGVGRPAAVFVMERLLDLAAQQIGMDPAVIRQRNLVQPDEFPYRSAVGLIWDQSAFTQGLQAALDHFDYPQARLDQAKARAEGRWVGLGLATYAELSGIGSRISAAPGMAINTGTDICTIALDSTGVITASFGCASHGQGHETTLAQVLCDELGSRLEDVCVRTGNTQLVPHGTGSYASRTAIISGGAGMLAARELKQRMLRLAAHLLNAPAEDLIVLQSVISTKAGTARLTFVELARALYAQMGRMPADLREDLVVTKSYDPVVGTTTSATHLVQVEVDPRTFAVHIQRYVIAEDCGRIINPLIVEGQTRGALAQGIGAALLEELVYDPQGQLLTANFADYLLPSAPEVPRLELVHIPSVAANNIGGFRGVGEGGTIGAPAAIANAVSDAIAHLGVTVMELPVTPERLFQLVRHQIKPGSALRTPVDSTPTAVPA